MTTKITTTCDKCGEELSDGRGREFQLNYKDMAPRMYLTPSTFLNVVNFHLCEDCCFKENIFVRNSEDALTQAERVVRLLSELLESMGVTPQD